MGAAQGAGVWMVYILACGDGSLYTGIACDLTARLEAHTRGTGAKYTRGRGPHRLLYSEEVADKGAALRREAAIKRLKRRQKLALAGVKNFS